MRMPLLDFLTNGDLKFVVVLYVFLIVAFIYFFKKLKEKENQEVYNQKIKKLVNWSIVISVFSLMLGLLHSFYFISKAGGVNNNLLFGGLSNMLITPTLGMAIAIVIQLLSTPLKEQKKL
ncbi:MULTISPECIES: hypothetical protein [unclassified Tenacibaculum]|uniref:hypothetical protein n=1 Tax=unclassified Tenacibaculum TaxID=2635139 RepID=UPI001F361BD7|nr:MULTISPECIES: hypothetical protein [unclassified Tenacibaculum]MCF2875299.1 hypothetical protein [Tenacibaculum sp. Cn5-1]MCF2935375.1 hypothetical protein [Tenacibaculum sp. Cn5-34]MCG7511935.1 hypothetical protein [Tenacibaculum sp. Cn5-46]